MSKDIYFDSVGFFTLYV